MSNLLMDWSNSMREELMFEMEEEHRDPQVQTGHTTLPLRTVLAGYTAQGAHTSQAGQTSQTGQAGHTAQAGQATQAEHTAQEERAEALPGISEYFSDESEGEASDREGENEDGEGVVEPLQTFSWNRRPANSVDDQREKREELDVSRVTWPHLYGKDGDTLVIVVFPKLDAKACNGLPWSGRKEFRMDSAVLLNTRSVFFEKAFSEKQQARYCRRLRIDQLPEGIRYILDLTPSQEGDDAAALLADLSVPSGARDWWMSKERLGVPAVLVSGHDDACRYHDSMPDNCIKDDGYIAESRVNLNDDYKYKVTLSLTACVPCYERDIRDYCEIRHRANIIRLLLCVAGHDLVLNSAPRVYTIVGLAKYFDLTALVSSHVRAWLEQHNNSSFIDIHPEIAMEMLWKLQLNDMVRTPLRVIVAERVLEPDPTRVNPVTVFGRPRTSLSDDINEVVQHATTAVRSRTVEAARSLVSSGSVSAYEWLQIPAWRQLASIRDTMQSQLLAIDVGRVEDREEAQKYVAEIEFILDTMNQYMTRAVNDALSAVPYPVQLEEINSDRRAYLTREIFPEQYGNIIRKFTDEQFLMMKVFWNRLRTRIERWEDFKTMLVFDLNGPVQRTLAGMYQDFFWSLQRPHAAVLFPSLFQNDPDGPVVRLRDIHDQLYIAMADVERRWCPLPEELETPLRRTQHLALGMAEEEFRFLPLWAGGLDDGTGGVFADMTVPDADMGPIEPGPGYRTGQTVASSTADSDATIIGGGVSLRVAASGSTTDTSFVEVDHDEVLSLSDDEGIEFGSDDDDFDMSITD